MTLSIHKEEDDLVKCVMGEFDVNTNKEVSFVVEKYGFRDFLERKLKWIIEKAKQIQLKEIEKGIIEIKEAVRKTGTFKYDSCYDDCLNLLKELEK